MLNFSKRKKGIKIIVSLFIAFSLSTISLSAARKLITKSVSGSFWTNSSMTYSFRTAAGLTYNGSSISSISDASFSGATCNSGYFGGSCMIIPRQKSKRYSGNTATYVITLTRNAMGFYVDKVDYTFTYKTTDAGSPFSIEKDPNVLVTVEVGEAYDIVITDNLNNK